MRACWSDGHERERAEESERERAEESEREFQREGFVREAKGQARHGPVLARRKRGHHPRSEACAAAGEREQLGALPRGGRCLAPKETNESIILKMDENE